MTLPTNITADTPRNNPSHADIHNQINTLYNEIREGKAGGQTLIGGNAASEDLTLQSTTHATKGSILFGSSSYDELNNRLGIGTITPSTTLHVEGSAYLGTSNDRITLGVGMPAEQKGIVIDFGNLSANNGRIQSEHQGTAYHPLAINPSGGLVGIGTGSNDLTSASFPNTFLVLKPTSTTSHVMADFIFDTTGDNSNDSGALRSVARQLGSGQAHIRAAESHVLRGGTSTINYTWAHEFGIHTNISGNGVDQNLGLYIANSHTGWSGITGVRADSAILIQGEDGWTNALTYRDTDDSTILFQITQTGGVRIEGALDHNGTSVGFYGTAPISKQTGVAVTAAGIHTALVNLGLIAA